MKVAKPCRLRIVDGAIQGQSAGSKSIQNFDIFNWYCSNSIVPKLHHEERLMPVDSLQKQVNQSRRGIQ
jgi:hypothetical protein